MKRRVNWRLILSWVIVITGMGITLITLTR